MQIIEVNEVVTILTQIGYLLGIGALLLCMYAALQRDRKYYILFDIAKVMLVIALILGLYDGFYGEKKLQYEAVVTQIEEVENNGYAIVKHKDDDIYILEKIKEQ